MSEATDPEASKAPHPHRGRGRRLVLRTGLLLLALLALFHQPLLREGLRQGAIRLAARENVRLSLAVEGSVWTHLILKNVRAVSTGNSPVDAISIEWLRVDYNLWKLLRQGRRESLSSYELRNASLALDNVRGTEVQRKKIAHVLVDILEQPALYSDRARVENFSLTIRAEEGAYEFKGVHTLLDPDRMGYVRVGKLTIPEVGSWHDLHTHATFINRHLIMRDFSLGDEVRVARLELDASGRNEGVASLSFEGTLWGGDMGLFLWRKELPSGEVRAQLTAFLSGMPMESLARYGGWRIPVTGNLKSSWVQISGDPDTPSRWDAQITAEVEKGTVAGFAVDAASAKVAMHDGLLRFEELECSTGKNRLSLQGQRRLTENADLFHWHGLETTFVLDAPELSALHPAFTGGRVQAQGNLHFQEESLAVEGNLTASEVRGRDFGIKEGHAEFQSTHRLHPHGGGGPWYEGLAGHARVEVSALHYREFAANRLWLDVPMTGDTARHAKVTLDLNGKDKLEGEADFTAREPFAYEGRLAGSVQDIAVLQPFFPWPLGGALEIDWHGAGELASLRHTGEGRATLQHGRLGMLTGVEGELAGVYSPESIDFSALRVRCDQGTFQAGVRLRDQRLQVDGLRLTAPQIGTVTGSFSLPLDLRTPTVPGTVFPSNGPLQGAIALEQVDIAKVLPTPQSGGVALSGTLSGSLTASGTMGVPEVTAKLLARNLKSDTTAKLAPASGDATLLFKGGQLVVSGSLAQPGLSPMLFKGSMPLDLPKTLAERRIDLATPIVFSVKLPPSPAGLFAPFLPGVRFLEGRLSVDASARGTLGKPVFSGGAAFDLAAVRFLDADLPGINRLQGDLRFAGTELGLQRCTGDVAGGPFSITGRLKLDALVNPVLDLRFQSQNTLLVRNDSLTLRANSDLRIAGPVNAAQVSGRIGLTKSRFFREVEILPIGLPGHPAPKVASGGYDLSTEIAPFRNWTYNVAIQTDEPFVVKGNLANGNITGDLHLGGTGFAPTLEGTAHIENMVASLPFSRLTVDGGALYFSGNAEINPTLDIHGSSRIRDYTVNVYLYGTANEPQTLFTSEPALPQEEVIALLATGATSRDISQNNQALAGRAAVLLFQDLYRKTFSRKPSLSNPANPMDRFSLDVGSVDPRTGKQELMGRYKLSDQYQISAGIDVQGDMRMQLQYLIRFR